MNCKSKGALPLLSTFSKAGLILSIELLLSLTWQYIDSLKLDIETMMLLLLVEWREGEDA
jgi:hypothetical protein